MFKRWLKLLMTERALPRLSKFRTADHLEFGEWGERLALRYLESSGFRVVMRNFTVPVGSRPDGGLVTGEIDIIAYDEAGVVPVLTFLEVKTRSSDILAKPEAAVDRRKQRQMVRAARAYRRLLRVWDEPYRYDVVAIVARPGQSPEVSLRRGFFCEEDLARQRRREAWLPG